LGLGALPYQPLAFAAPRRWLASFFERVRAPTVTPRELVAFFGGAARLALRLSFMVLRWEREPVAAGIGSHPSV
jgi:hypothetical protein